MRGGCTVQSPEMPSKLIVEGDVSGLDDAVMNHHASKISTTKKVTPVVMSTPAIGAGVTTAHSRDSRNFGFTASRLVKRCSA